MPPGHVARAWCCVSHACPCSKVIIVNRLPLFQLEEYFRRYSFQPGMVNLSPSNPISPTIGEVLEVAGLA